MGVRCYTKYKVLISANRANGSALVLVFAIGAMAVGWSCWRAAIVGDTRDQVRSPIAKLPSARAAVSAAVTNAAWPAIATDRRAERPAPSTGGPVTDRIAAGNSKSVERSTEAGRALLWVPRIPQNVFETQIALARRGISPGSLDGILGSQTRAAIRAFQSREGLPITGELDTATKARLVLHEPPARDRVIATNDLERLLPVAATWLEKSQQPRLDYENILELLAEDGWAHPNLIRQFNPTVSWTNVQPGNVVVIPNVAFPVIRGKASFLRIRLSERNIQAWDSSSNLLAHFPCSVARRVEKRPVGQLFVEKVALNPSYRFDPAIFPESAEARKLKRILILPPGPNGPVGTAWIGLNLPGYGIHGTPRPEEVGRTESHGCFRLANWNAEFLAQLVRVGTPVFVEP